MQDAIGSFFLVAPCLLDMHAGCHRLLCFNRLHPTCAACIPLFRLAACSDRAPPEHLHQRPAMVEVKDEDVKMETGSETGTVKYEPLVDFLEDSDFQDCQGISDRSQLRKALCDAFEKLCHRHGGPVQWLLRKFDTQEKEKAFQDYLLDTFPLMSTIEYVVPSLLSKKEKSFVHISMLSFAPQHSTKPLPYSCTCKELLDEYLMHGFLTDSQALLLWVTADDKAKPVQEFKPRYVKGMARCSTLLALVALMKDLKVDMLASFPHLYQSVQVLHAIFETHADVASVAIANAHHSNRGSIRAPHDVLTWVCKLWRLEKLEGAGYTASPILERFNQGATNKAGVTGNRRTSALHLLQPACRAGVEMMENLLGTVGLQGVWWCEDTFCNKKLLPGHTMRGGRTIWNSILTVTESSFNTWVESLCRQQMNKKSKNRKSLDKTRLEEHALLCSFWCWSLKQAVDNALGGPELDAIHEKFLDGDVALALDVQTLLHEKKGDIEFKDVSLISISQ